MRFESVNAYTFGPFRNETLILASGMNVVFGPNEAGKSSWHAALYAGLCGMRRARGRASKDDAYFAERHRPWDNDTSWDVGVTVALDDGRHVELRHDLNGRIDSNACDVDIAGRDYSNEIMHDGAPDGARWLGLDRRSFVMTACIRQSDILGLLDSPAELQDELQRAADTTDHDGTAVEAIVRLRDFRADSVGSTRSPTKPLRITQERVQDAQQQLEEAQATHEEYLNHWIKVDELDRRARNLEHALVVARAARAAEVASKDLERLERARELSARFPRGAPRRPSQNENLAALVASALTTWKQRPVLREPEGQTIAILEARLAEANLCLAVSTERSAREAKKRLGRAQELNARFPRGRPATANEGDQLVSRIASALATWESRPDVHEPVGPTMAKLKQDLLSVEGQLGEEAESTTSETGEASAGLLATLFRAIRMLFSTLLRLFGSGRRRPLMQPEKRELLEEQRGLIRQQIAAREEVERQWEKNTLRAREAADGIREAASAVGLAASDPDVAAAALHQWQKDRIERVTEADNQMKDWEELQQLLGQDSLDDLAKKAMAARDEALSAATHTDAEALAAALSEPQPARLQEAISERERLALIREIGERRKQEKEFAEAATALAKTEKVVSEAARAVGIEADGPDEQIAALHSWQGDRNAELKEVDREVEAWEELQRILGQDSLDELIRRVKQLSAEAHSLSVEASVEDIADLSNPLTEAELRRTEDEAHQARTAFEREQSQLQLRGQGLADVAEAEEALVSAKSEYARIRSLDCTLDLAIHFLEQAQERVHRTIAPVLAKTVREWLPRVTSGRYTDCRIDPEQLAVEVAMANGRWRPAEVLSHGTAEQVYLLLRLALTSHLTSQSCPLILDDALAASDRQRKHDLLETLLAVSESTQVILFTHEEDVCAWARERLVSEPHKLTELGIARTLM